jgi:predicted protein tyrosine phosphatase
MGPKFEICSLRRARRIKRRFDAVLTIEDPEGQKFFRCLRFHKKPEPHHKVLKFEDLDQPYTSIVTATRSDILEILRFTKKHGGENLLIHCNAGISRSTAAGLLFLSDRLGPGKERKALDELIAIQPSAVPNLLIVQLGDQILGRKGKLLGAVKEWDKTRPENAIRRRKNKELILNHYGTDISHMKGSRR